MIILAILFGISLLNCFLSGNFFPTVKNLSLIKKQSLEINSVSNYWPSVQKSMLSLEAPYTSVVGLSLAVPTFLFLVPFIFYKTYFFKSSDAKHKNFFKGINQNQIKELVKLLHEELPAKSTKNNYQLNLGMLFDGNKSVMPLEQELQEAANKMCKHLLLKKPIKVITLANVGAGKYERIGNMSTIYVNKDLTKQNIKQKLAILAHEMAHYFLDVKQIKFSETNKNELLTEICTIYIGFGLILLNGYKFNLDAKNNGYSKVGYVDEKVILEAIIQTAIIRKQNPMWLLKNVPPHLNVMLRYRLRNLIKAYQASKKKNA